MCSTQRPLDDRSQLRIQAEAVLGIVSRCEAGKVELIASAALRFENQRNPHPVRRMFAEDGLSLAGQFAGATDAVEERARGYQALGIKPLDAFHLASAVEGGADYFCTSDDKLLRRARVADTGQTRAVSPLELIKEMEP